MEGIIIALLVCLVLALVSKYLTIPAIPFYIIAGVVLGQAGLGIVASDQISSFFSNMGLIFLLFFVGLGLKVDKISENQREVLTSGIIDLNVNMLIGFVAAYLLGFSLVESLIVAAAFYQLQHRNDSYFFNREPEADDEGVGDHHLADGL